MKKLRGTRESVEAEIIQTVHMFAVLKMTVEEIAAELGKERSQIAKRLQCRGISIQRPRGNPKPTIGDSTDASCPKFARHDEHVAQLMAHGGYFVLSERQTPRGPVVCLPLVRLVTPQMARAG